VVVALQSIAARETDPLKSVVVTVTKIHGGDAYNVIPDGVKLSGTVRTLLPELRDMAETRIKEIATGIAMAMGAQAQVSYHRGYPVTFNHAAETAFALDIMRKVVGDQAVSDEFPPAMGAEDFSYMLEARPGSFVFIGNGDTANLHNSAYDFNDEAIPYGISYWVTLAETALAA
jgi:hippurate hydrolase